MNLAEKKKENNIAEYIIHMYQTEDLIRAYEFDIERIQKNLIALMPLSDGEKIALGDWYRELIATMQKEGITATGHLKEVQDRIAEMIVIYNELVDSDNDFKHLLDTARPYLERRKPASGNDVQICLDGMYAYLILRADDMPVPDLTVKSANIFGEVLSYLSYKYKQRHYMSDN